MAHRERGIGCLPVVEIAAAQWTAVAPTAPAPMMLIFALCMVSSRSSFTCHSCTI